MSSKNLGGSSPSIKGTSNAKEKKEDSKKEKEKDKSSREGSEDVVESERLDFGEYEQKFRKLTRKDSLPDVVSFPKDEVLVQDAKRKRRTIKAVVPEDLRPADGSPDHIQDCMRLYTKEYRFVQRPFAHHSLNGEIKDNYDVLADQEYEVDAKVESSSKDKDNSESTVKPFLEDTRDVEIIRKEKRKGLVSDRASLFVTFPMEHPQDPVDQRQNGRPFKEAQHNQIQVQCTELAFELGLHEPFFCTFALYDLKKQEKISETFHFDLNPDAILKLLGPHLNTREAATAARQAIFSTSYVSPDIYLVLIVSKCLHGDDEESTAPYFNAAKIKDKDKEKFITEARQFALRLGGYRQPFGYVAIQLYDENQQLKPNSETTFPGLFKIKTEKDIFSWIERAGDSKSRSGKMIPGKTTISITKVGEKDKIKGRLNPSLVPVNPYPKNFGEDVNKHEIIREMADFTRRFPESSAKFSPYLAFENNLFFLPEIINFSRYSAHGVSTRNLCCEVKLLDDDSDPNKPGLKVIYGTSVDSSFTDKGRTHVFYHNRKPLMFDEFKIRLPTYLTPKHHLLVTFYHMTCAFKKSKQNQAVETVVAQCAIPLLVDGRMRKDEVFSVPVAVRLLPGYLAGDVEGTKWADNNKEVFTFRLKTMSSIYPQDQALDAFFKQYQAANNAADHEGLMIAMQDLAKVDHQTLLEYFPTVFDILFRIMSNGSNTLQAKAFSAVLSVVDIVSQASHRDSPLLESFVQYFFENHAQAKHLLSEVIVDSWLIHLLQNQAAQNPHDLTVRYAWFLFSVIYKSMVLMLEDRGALGDEKREGRFSKQFMNMLLRLIIQLSKKTKELASHYGIGKFLNNNVSFFLRDLFTLLDRGLVFEMVQKYVLELENFDPSMVIVITEYKFRFLKIICDYEHYLQLNLPLADDLSHTNVMDIKKSFWKKHFLAGLLLDEIEKCVDKPQREVRLIAIHTLRDVMWKHDNDSRYKSQDKKERIAQIYFPYMLMVIDNFNKPRDNFLADEKRNWLVCFIFVLKNLNRQLLQNWWKRDQTAKRKKAFVDVMAAALTLFEYVGKESLSQRSPIETTIGISPESEVIPEASPEPEEKDKSSKRKHAASKASTPTRFVKRSYGGSISASDRLTRISTKEALEAYYKPRASVALARAANSQGDLLSFDTATTVLTLPAIIKKEQNLAREVCLTVLDIAMDFIADHKQELLKKENVEADKHEVEKIFDKVFSVIIEAFKRNFPRKSTESLLEQLIWIIPRFRQPLFRFRTPVTGDLVYQLMRHCNSKFLSVRSMASGTILLLIKQNFEEMKNFSRMKLQTTISMSKIFAGDVFIKNGIDCLRESLKVIKIQAQNKLAKEKTKHGSLGNEVKELTARLEQIIEDNLKMEEYSFDPETKADLYHQISQGYLDSPDLRITELDKLAQLHQTSQNYEEAAMVRIAQAILVAEYLRLLGRIGTDAMPTNGIQVFPSLSSEIKMPKKQELESLEQEICQSKLFTEDGFVVLLKEAVGQLKRQILFETCVEVYRLLLPVFQFRRNYGQQALCYKDLTQLCKSSVEEMQSNQRIFAQYYRVAFWARGERLQELNAKQYIYKEQGGIRLSDFSTRLQTQFSKKVPADNIHLVSNLTTFDTSTVKDGHLYIQLVSLEAYFTQEELDNIQTLFERHFNITRFVYETPFSKGSSKISEKIEEQWKRKTIIKIDNAFPFIKKRLKINDSDVQTIELSPIENAIELIQKKAQAMQGEINKVPRNTKTLQMELQGTLLLQVNAGPAAVMTTFLQAKKGTFDSKYVNQLTQDFANFIKFLAEGVAVNNAMIGPEQLTLQYELVNGYFKLKESFCAITGTSPDSIPETFTKEENERLAPSINPPASPGPGTPELGSRPDTPTQN